MAKAFRYFATKTYAYECSKSLQLVMKLYSFNSVYMKAAAAIITVIIIIIIIFDLSLTRG